MTPEVIELLRPLSAGIARFPRVALLSPGKAERALFPQASVLRRQDWDLARRRRDLRFDLIIACHVFHYASDPACWFDNVRSSCRALLIADLIRRKRSPDAELGADGDAMRYAIDEHRPTLPGYFDLGGLGESLLARHVFAGATNEYGPALHVLALIRGKLEGPLIHLDGYPPQLHGVEESSSLHATHAMHAIIDAFEKRAAPAYLGIAPALLEPAMVDYLRSLRSVEPAMHSHQLEPRKRPRLFDELVWASPKRVYGKLQRLKSQLEHHLARDVSTYVAPGGRITRRSARALAALGFDLCISDRQVHPSQIPSTRSDFVGSSQTYPTATVPEVVGLNLRSEWELGRTARGDGLRGMFEAIDAQRRASQERVRQLAVRIAAL
jgi:hypothetical protein